MSTDFAGFDTVYERDATGAICSKVVEVPFRPEFITYYTPSTNPLPVMPWAEPDPLKDVSALPQGTLTGPEPEPLLSCFFGIDMRACARYGFNIIDVEKVEMPTLDYAKAENLVMRVFVRIRKGA